MSRNLYWDSWDTKPKYVKNEGNCTWNKNLYNTYPEYRDIPFNVTYGKYVLLDTHVAHMARVTRIYE